MTYHMAPGPLGIHEEHHPPCIYICREPQTDIIKN